MIPTTAGEAGLGNEITIDGTMWPRPQGLEWVPVHARSMTPSMARPRLELWRMGDGLPNVLDRGEWVLPFVLSDDYKSLNEYLERLRTDGELHYFSEWKKRIYTFTSVSGQREYWLPRADAFGFGGVVDDAAKAVITLNGGALLLTYKPIVSATDAVPVGDVWLSQTLERHPAAGIYGVRFVVGSPIAIYDRVQVEHYAKYRVVVADHATEPFERVGIEEKEIVLMEVP